MRVCALAQRVPFAKTAYLSRSSTAMARAGSQQPSLLCRSYGASGEEIASIDADVNRTMEAPMRKLQQRQPNDLSRFVTALDMDTTLILEGSRDP